jgi:hypothetical protein
VRVLGRGDAIRRAGLLEIIWGHANVREAPLFFTMLENWIL